MVPEMFRWDFPVTSPECGHFARTRYVHGTFLGDVPNSPRNVPWMFMECTVLLGLLVPGLSRRCALLKHLFRTIGFTGNETKICQVSWLSNYGTHRQNIIYMPFCFWYFTHFSICLLYKDATQSDCTQRYDVTVLSETFRYFRNVFEKF